MAKTLSRSSEDLPALTADGWIVLEKLGHDDVKTSEMREPVGLSLAEKVRNWFKSLLAPSDNKFVEFFSLSRSPGPTAVSWTFTIALSFHPTIHGSVGTFLSRPVYQGLFIPSFGGTRCEPFDVKNGTTARAFQ